MPEQLKPPPELPGSHMARGRLSAVPLLLQMLAHGLEKQKSMAHVLGRIFHTGDSEETPASCFLLPAPCSLAVNQATLAAEAIWGMNHQVEALSLLSLSVTLVSQRKRKYVFVWGHGYNFIVSYQQIQKKQGFTFRC